MKNLLLTGILTLGLGLTAVNANTAAEALDRHLVKNEFDLPLEGPRVCEFSEAKYQEIKTARTVKVASVSQPTSLDRILQNAFESSRTCEDHYIN